MLPTALRSFVFFQFLISAALFSLLFLRSDGGLILSADNAGSSTTEYGHAMDYVGQRYGRWVITGTSKWDGTKTVAMALCDCGTVKDVNVSNLKRGLSQSCGCFNQEKRTKHGDHKSRLYGIWHHMRRRCHQPTDRQYKDWGGRGITVCQEWRDSYPAFKAWSLLNGYSDNLTIERRDNDKGYKPSNCRWATPQEQNQNTRQTKLSPARVGLIRTLGEAGKTHRWIAAKFGVAHSCVGNVLRGETWGNV